MLKEESRRQGVPNVRISHRVICLAAVALAVWSPGRISPAQSRPQGDPSAARPPQTAPATPSLGGTKIAVIDISYVFANNNRFKQLMEGMKKDVEAFEAELKQRGAQLQKKREQLLEHRPGSPDYKRIEGEIASIQAQTHAETQLKRSDFLQREAKIYYDVYREIVQEVSYFAQRHGIDLVVRFSSENIEADNRKSVLEGVNRAIVYQNRLNITYEISERLNQAAPPQAAAPPAATPRRR
jgi:Skp family chaperone for outer membrane proteins